MGRGWGPEEAAGRLNLQDPRATSRRVWCEEGGEAARTSKRVYGYAVAADCNRIQAVRAELIFVKRAMPGCSLGARLKKTGPASGSK